MRGWNDRMLAIASACILFAQPLQSDVEKDFPTRNSFFETCLFEHVKELRLGVKPRCESSHEWRNHSSHGKFFEQSQLMYKTGYQRCPFNLVRRICMHHPVAAQCPLNKTSHAYNACEQQPSMQIDASPKDKYFVIWHCTAQPGWAPAASQAQFKLKLHHWLKEPALRCRKQTSAACVDTKPWRHPSGQWTSLSKFPTPDFEKAHEHEYVIQSLSKRHPLLSISKQTRKCLGQPPCTSVNWLFRTWLLMSDHKGGFPCKLCRSGWLGWSCCWLGSHLPPWIFAGLHCPKPAANWWLYLFLPATVSELGLARLTMKTYSSICLLYSLSSP